MNVVLGQAIEPAAAEAVNAAVTDMNDMRLAPDQDQCAQGRRHAVEIWVLPALGDDPPVCGFDGVCRRPFDAQGLRLGEITFDQAPDGDFGCFAPAGRAANAIGHRREDAAARSLLGRAQIGREINPRCVPARPFHWQSRPGRGIGFPLLSVDKLTSAGRSALELDGNHAAIVAARHELIARAVNRRRVGRQIR